MSLKKGSQKSYPKPRSIYKSATQPSGKPSKDQSGTALAPSQGPNFNNRTRSSAHSALFSGVSDPELILRKPRKPQSASQTQGRSQYLTQTQITRLKRSVETLLANQQQQITEEVADHRYEEAIPTDSEYLDSENIDSENTDPSQAFYLKVGYLPPLDEEASKVIEQIIAQLKMADEYTRIGPENPLFSHGLQCRNVSVKEGPYDSYMDVIKRLPPGDSDAKIDEELELNRQLWTWDQRKCEGGSNEALFQRTLMMSLIARHRLIYTQDDSLRNLDFSVEESWSCPPMPTRAYWMGSKFLTQPRPDLAVSFSRRAVIDDIFWKAIPIATMRLACFENITESSQERIFPFFTIEAKRANTSSDNIKGKNQSLNNASQALHNMFEFFRDAGSEHEEIFFNKVRFFSMVVSTEGLTIRIHRATRLASKEPRLSFILPGNRNYPLSFEYQEFFKLEKAELDQEVILKIIQQILITYGIGELLVLLKNAARALVDRLSNNLKEMQKRGYVDFYRYGQTVVAPSKRPTPARSQTPSTPTTPVRGQAPSKPATPTRSQTS
ncbi:MAG: hypothetical protein Q9160_009203 [Pyrenula sp. 1 TL-2023]